MHLTYSHEVAAAPRHPAVARAVEQLSEADLRASVEALAVPRHYLEESGANRKVMLALETRLRSCGFQVRRQSPWSNLVAEPAKALPGPPLLIGCHYDSVPKCPGADDNASALAVALAVAEAIGDMPARLRIVFFNREEEADMPGSTAYVEELLEAPAETHILEMVGYHSRQPGSQSVPRDLPIELHERGDFLAVLGADAATPLLPELQALARTYAEELPVAALAIELQGQPLSRHLFRSDHVPFWRRGFPATMWTDTSNFRNPHYHQPSDTPETLDYGFMRQVAALLLARVLTACTESPAAM